MKKMEYNTLFSILKRMFVIRDFLYFMLKGRLQNNINFIYENTGYIDERKSLYISVYI